MVVELNRPALRWNTSKPFSNTLKLGKPSQVGEELAATDVGEEHVEEALVFAAPGQVNQEGMIDLLRMRKMMMVMVMTIITVHFSHSFLSPENFGWPSFVRVSHQKMDFGQAPLGCLGTKDEISFVQVDSKFDAFVSFSYFSACHKEIKNVLLRKVLNVHFFP